MRAPRALHARAHRAARAAAARRRGRGRAPRLRAAGAATRRAARDGRGAVPARTSDLSPKRGTIYDRNGAELAVSVDVDSVYANPRQLRAAGADPQQVARAALAALLGVDAGAIAQRLAQRSPLRVDQAPRLARTRARRCARSSIAGHRADRRSRAASIPNRELAAHVLGFANVDGSGIEGLELRARRRSCAARRARCPAIRDRRGARRVLGAAARRPRRAGRRRHAHLDKTIQHIAERELELAVRTFEAKAGSVVVLDPRTGEILAMANFPTLQSQRARGASRERTAATARSPIASSRARRSSRSRWPARSRPASVRADQRIDCEDGTLQVARVHDPRHAQVGRADAGRDPRVLEQHRHRQDRHRAWAARGCTARCATSASARAPASTCRARPPASCATTSAGTTWTRPRSRSARA